MSALTPPSDPDRANMPPPVKGERVRLTPNRLIVALSVAAVILLAVVAVLILR